MRVHFTYFSQKHQCINTLSIATASEAPRIGETLVFEKPSTEGVKFSSRFKVREILRTYVGKTQYQKEGEINVFVEEVVDESLAEISLKEDDELELDYGKEL